MARNVTVYDLENYPDNSKTVTIDQQSVVPTGYAGDEQWVLSFVTSAYSNNTNRTAIQDIWVEEMATGWYKSSGLVSLGASINIGATNKVLGINIDNSSGWYYVQLTEDTYGPNSLATHIEDQIRAVPDTGLWNSNDDTLAYKNAQVEYANGKFKIISGTVSDYYTGTNRTSVAVTYSGTDTLYYDLGFDLGIGSYEIASTDIKESSVTSTCGPSSTAIPINTMTGLVAGDPIAITNKTTTDYVIAQPGTTTTNIVIISGSLNNTYTVSGTYAAKVQKLRIQDPDQQPVMYHNNVDSITRWGIMSIANQIDFSS
jgi:hypothetical protein